MYGAFDIHPRHCNELFDSLYQKKFEPNSKGVFPSKIALLEGVTGSGKTEVYLQLAKQVINKGQSVLILVPEIALSSDLHKRVQEEIEDKEIHQKLSPGKHSAFLGTF